MTPEPTLVLNLMREAILAAEKLVPGLNVDQDKIVSYLSTAIDLIVQFKNAIGSFRQPTTPAAG